MSLSTLLPQRATRFDMHAFGVLADMALPWMDQCRGAFTSLRSYCASRHVSGVLVNPVIKSNALSMHWHHYWYNINICHDQDNVMYNDIVIHDIAIVHVSAKLTSLMSFNL